jgi:hypothetical protein
MVSSYRHFRSTGEWTTVYRRATDDHSVNPAGNAPAAGRAEPRMAAA